MKIFLSYQPLRKFSCPISHAVFCTANKIFFWGKNLQEGYLWPPPLSQIQTGEGLRSTHSPTLVPLRSWKWVFLIQAPWQTKISLSSHFTDNTKLFSISLLELVFPSLPDFPHSGKNTFFFHSARHKCLSLLNSSWLCFPPSVVFIHLKRFEFNFATEMQIKVNSRYEFYDEITLKPNIIVNLYVFLSRCCVLVFLLNLPWDSSVFPLDCSPHASKCFSTSCTDFLCLFYCDSCVCLPISVLCSVMFCPVLYDDSHFDSGFKLSGLVCLLIFKFCLFVVGFHMCSAGLVRQNNLHSCQLFQQPHNPLPIFGGTSS